MSKQTEPVQHALSGLLFAGMFVIRPEVWPGFVAYVERERGKQWAATPDKMMIALALIEGLRLELEGTT